MKARYLLLIAFALPLIIALLIAALPFATIVAIVYLFKQPKEIEKQPKQPPNIADFIIKSISHENKSKRNSGAKTARGVEAESV